MKIAIVSTYPPKKCGIGIYTRNMANAMKKHKVEIITFKGLDYKDERAKSILEKHNPFSYIKAASYLKKFDVVLIQHEYILYNCLYFLLFLSILKLNGTKINIIMHTIAYYPGFGGFIFKVYHEFMFLFVDKLFLHTKIAQKKLNEKTFFKKSAVIVPHPIPKKYKKVRIPGKKKVYNLLCFGFLDYSKGFDIACRAVGNDKRYKLRIMGSVNELFEKKQKEFVEYLRGIIGLYKNIRLDVKFVTDEEKNKAFKEADFILLPYREIEQSGVLCDTWGHGKIPICSNIDSFKYEIDGKYGLTFMKDRATNLKFILDSITNLKESQRKILQNIDELLKKRSYEVLTNKVIEEIE